MNSLTKNLFRNILIIMLSVAMAFMLLFTSACADDDDDDDTPKDETTTEQSITDYQLIKNGDFEFSTDENSTYPAYSSISWSRSTDSGNTSAPSSTKTSGIIDTSDTAFDKIKNTIKIGNNAEFNPHTPNYFGLTQSNYDYEDEAKQVNPQSNGTKVYMLSNHTSKSGIVGTAQKIKSASSISIPANGYAVLSFWVNTYELKSNYTTTPGAYVSLITNVGSTSYEDISLTGINTKGEWAKFNLFIKGSDLASTSITPVFGLGKGNASSQSGYVEGQLFIDDVFAKVYDTLADYNEEKDGVEISVDVNDVANANSQLVAPSTYVDNGDKSDYNKDNPKTSYTTVNYQLNLRYSLLKDGATATNRTFLTSEYNSNVKEGYDKVTGNTLYKGSTIANLKLDATNYNLVKDALTDNDIKVMGLTNDDSVSFINFANPSTAYLLTDSIELSAGSYQFISFFAKVNAEHFGAKKATVSIVEKTLTDKTNTTQIFSSFSTEDVDGVFGSWQKYSIILYNPTTAKTNFQIKLIFGDDETALIENSYLLQKGYAIMAGLKTFETTKEIYDTISTGDTVNKTILYGDFKNHSNSSSSTTNNKESYNVSTDLQGSYEISSKPTTNVPGYTAIGDSEGVKKGIINSEYSYDGISDLDKFHANLKKGDNKYAQAVVISNSTNKNSGYRSNVNTLVANSFIKITLKIKVFGNATANVYVVSGDSSADVLTLNVGDDYSNALKTTITKDSYSNGNDWVNVTFYIASGNQEMTYRVEVWNGAREDGAQGSTGSIFFEHVNVDTSGTQEIYNTAMLDYKEEFASKQGFEFVGEKKHTRPNLTTITTGEDGEDVNTVTTFDEKTIYIGNDTVKFYDFSTVHADTEIDNRTETEDEENSDTETEDDGYTVTTDLALQISSIIIAVVLIIAMVAVVVRKNIKKRQNRMVKREQNYGGVKNRNQRELANERAKALKKVIVDDSDNTEDYDYEEAEAVEEESEVPTEIVIDEENIDETTETNEENSSEDNE